MCLCTCYAATESCLNKIWPQAREKREEKKIKNTNETIVNIYLNTLTNDLYQYWVWEWKTGKVKRKYLTNYRKHCIKINFGHLRKRWLFGCRWETPLSRDQIDQNETIPTILIYKYESAIYLWLWSVNT